MDQVSYYLKKFNFRERHILKNIFHTLHFSYSNSVKVLSYFYEIKRRERNTLINILDIIGYQNIIDNRQLNGKNKADEVIKRLFARRFPQTSKYLAGKKVRI